MFPNLASIPFQMSIPTMLLGNAEVAKTFSVDCIL